MKIRNLAFAAALTGLMGLGARTVSAQGTEIVHATVKFDFKVGPEVLPAGRYALSYDATQPGVLIIRGEDGRHNAVALTEGITTRTPSNDATLVFDRQGPDYVLAKVFGPGESEGLEVVGTPAAD